MTEALMIASNPYNGERKAGTVGMPLSEISIRIRETSTGKLVGHGTAGRIEVKGPNLFSGYWRNPKKTTEDFTRDGWFISGDLGEFDDQGYLRIAGREKDLIISGGLNIYPKEIEQEIDAIKGVLESAVVGLPHRDFGEAVTAFVVCAVDIKLESDQIVASLAKRLADFKLPKRVNFVASLPRNTMGKVQKNVLRDQHDTLYVNTIF